MAAQTVFERNTSVFINLTVTDPDSEVDIANVTITLMNSSGHTIINNASFERGVTVTNGYVFNLSFLIPENADFGLWNISVFANDSDGALASNYSNITIADNTPPSPYVSGHNSTGIYQGTSVLFNATWFDIGELSHYVFAINRTGDWTNTSSVVFTGVQNFSTNVSAITEEAGTLIAWRFYANDTSGNVNSSPELTFVVGGVAWNQTTITLPAANKNEGPQNSTVLLTGYLNNTNIRVACFQGDCAIVLSNFSDGLSLNGTANLVMFNCSTGQSGTFSANFSVNSTQDFYPHNLSVSCTVSNRAPVAETPMTWDNITFDNQTVFERNASVFVNVSVTDADGSADLRNATVTVLNSTNHTIISNDTMRRDGSISGGFIFNYSFLLSPTADEGTWRIYVFANDSDSTLGSNSTTFTVDDTVPPGTILNLMNASLGESWILWNWSNPSDPDLSHIEVWLNGTFRVNVTAPDNSTNITSLAANTCYQLQTRTVDTALNRNTTWVNDSACTSFSSDITPPSIQNVSNTSITDQSALITWDTDESSDTLVFYGTVPGSYPFNTTNLTDTLQHASLLAGLAPSTSYYYVVNSTDPAGNSNQSGEFNFTTLADATSPAWSSPWNDTPVTYSPSFFSRFNITWTDLGVISQVFIEVNKSGVLVNYSVTNLSAVYNLSVVLPAGDLSWRSHANDSVNNRNTTPSFRFTIARATPELNLTLNAIAGNTSINEDTNATLNGTLLTGDPYAIELYVEGALYGNASALSNITNFMNPGLFNITVVYRQSENYSRSALTYFLLVNDTTPPGITLNAPEQNFNTSSGTITFNWSANDNGVNYQLCNLTIDGSVNQSGLNLTNGSFLNITLSGIGSGTHAWNITCWDAALNANTSATRVFTVIGAASALGAFVNRSDNRTVIINWSVAGGADSYRIYFTDNLSRGFGPAANVSGLTDTLYQDSDSLTVSQRFYNVTAVAGSDETPPGEILGMVRATLDGQGSRWNLVSLPITLGNSRLRNATHGGYDVAVNTTGCMTEIWRYNASNPVVWEFTEWDNGAWTPAGGSEQFTSLHDAYGYWVFANRSCEWTMTGVVPQGTRTEALTANFSIRGWLSARVAGLPQTQSPYTIPIEPPFYPLESSPVNAVTRMYYYNASTESFRKVDHFSANSTHGWGWYPAAGSEDFMELVPGRAYYIRSQGASTWTINSSVG
ncbi:fibronectin type III domain-containing protein [Candidatus Woesearchaeota archaeon]|nr:fibronectin type III domain-containing protein [Candidatus Woesearchaeota archaeon]